MRKGRLPQGIESALMASMKSVRLARGARALLTAIAANVCLAAVKITAGVAGRSQALIADGIESLTNTLMLRQHLAMECWLGNRNVTMMDLILDGPTTYLLGPFQSRANLDRAIRNCVSLVSKLEARLVLLDHHLVREARFREKVEAAFAAGAMTAAELLGKLPLTDRVAMAKEENKLEELVSQAEAGSLDRELVTGREFDLEQLPIS